jgi:universal stress protein E
MFRKIVVLAHGPDPSQPAVQRAVLSSSSLTEIVLLDVAHEPLLDGYMGNKAIYEKLRARVVAERQEDLDSLAAKLRDRGLDVSCKAVWDYPLEEAVARQVRDAGADLFIFAPQDPHGGFLSSEWRVVTTCPSPVLVVRTPAAQQYRHIVAAVDPFREHGKPASLDLAILERARELQADTRATLSALHCFTPLEYFGADLAAPVSHVSGADARREEVGKLLERSGLSASYARLEIGRPHDVLARLAKAGEADVIVMGALARGAVKQWLIGSSAERVLREGLADVLAIKPAARH